MGDLGLVDFNSFHHGIKRRKVSLDPDGLAFWGVPSSGVQIVSFLGHMSSGVVMKLYDIDAIQPVRYETFLFWCQDRGAHLNRDNGPWDIEATTKGLGTIDFETKVHCRFCFGYPFRP
jgi:hypothetical protein